MSPRRSAFIDVGTNTVLCLIADIRETGRFRVLGDFADISRLGQGVDRTRRISAEGEQRALEILPRYRDHCQSLGVEEIFAVGTSALRDAENSAEVRARLQVKLGFEILVIDIGGGSSEFIRGNDGGVSQVLSVDVGSVRLTERFLHSDPVRGDEVAAMLATIDCELAPVIASFASANAALTLVGIAGSFTTVAAIEKRLVNYSHSEVHGSRLNLGEVRRQIQLFREKTIEERKQIVGLEAKRADVIFAGACLIERIMASFQAESVIVSDQGVRYGLLHERAQLF